MRAPGNASTEIAAPPVCAPRSSTTTERPARASRVAATSPLCPPPTITTSNPAGSDGWRPRRRRGGSYDPRAPPAGTASGHRQLYPDRLGGGRRGGHLHDRKLDRGQRDQPARTLVKRL